MRGFLEGWERLTITSEQLIDAGDRVFAQVRQSGRGRSSRVPVEMRYFQVWTFGEEGVVRLESIMHEAEAIEAAGITAEALPRERP